MIKFDQTAANEDEFFYNAIISQAFSIFSPFEVDRNIDFPKKDELGGVVLKFLGGGAAYFKIQSKMPSDEEVQSIYEVGKFLQDSFGEYVEICVLCMPDIEIRDITTLGDEVMSTDFVSLRKSNSNDVFELLMEKLENNDWFAIEDHILRVFLPFMSRKSDEEFQSKYWKLIELFNRSNQELPSVSDLAKSRMCYGRWFSNDYAIYSCYGYEKNYFKFER